MIVEPKRKWRFGSKNLAASPTEDLAIEPAASLNGSLHGISCAQIYSMR